MPSPSSAPSAAPVACQQASWSPKKRRPHGTRSDSRCTGRTDDRYRREGITPLRLQPIARRVLLSVPTQFLGGKRRERLSGASIEGRLGGGGGSPRPALPPRGVDRPGADPPTGLGSAILRPPSRAVCSAPPRPCGPRHGRRLTLWSLCPCGAASRCHTPALKVWPVRGLGSLGRRSC